MCDDFYVDKVCVNRMVGSICSLQDRINSVRYGDQGYELGVNRMGYRFDRNNVCVDSMNLCPDID